MLTGKKALIVGMASNRSIAYGVAESMAAQGAELAFTYQGEKLQNRVIKMAAEFGSDLVFPCDVTSDEEIASMAAGVRDAWGELDILVHSVAYAPSDQLEGDYLANVSRSGFSIAHEVSSYSLSALVSSLRPLFNSGAAIATMTYQGSERVVPNYNVMGVAKASLEASVRYLATSLGPDNIRINSVSAGPIRTLAAAGIKNFRKLLAVGEKINPLRCNVTIKQVGDTTAFLCSDMASGITGEVIHVDAGFHSVAAILPEED